MWKEVVGVDRVRSAKATRLSHSLVNCPFDGQASISLPRLGWHRLGSVPPPLLGSSLPNWVSSIVGVWPLSGELATETSKTEYPD